jgi:hypothetical protein
MAQMRQEMRGRIRLIYVQNNRFRTKMPAERAWTATSGRVRHKTGVRGRAPVRELRSQV